MIVIHPYREHWPAEFLAIQARLRSLLAGHTVHIAHIGSTAVPALAAKDIVDIQVGVERLDAQYTTLLPAAGFVHVSQHTMDHLPPGADAPPDQWQKLYFRSTPPIRPCHIHLRVLGSANQRYALLFRDYLRVHPGARRTIDVIKRQLARLHGSDADAYYAVKDPVYDLVWESAQEWARRSGWEASSASEA